MAMKNKTDYIDHAFIEWFDNVRDGDKFCAEVLTHGGSFDKYKHEKTVYGHVKLEPADYGNLFLTQSWSMGGTHGNCWDDTMSSSEGEMKPLFTELDTMVELIKEDLSFMKYRTKVLPLIETYTTSYGDYYGGSTSTGHEVVNLYKLWKALMWNESK
jgi:hypothetical protein